MSGTGDGRHLGTPQLTAPPTTSTHPVNLSRLARESVPPLGDPAQGGGDGLITVRYEFREFRGRVILFLAKGARRGPVLWTHKE